MSGNVDFSKIATPVHTSFHVENRDGTARPIVYPVVEDKYGEEVSQLFSVILGYILNDGGICYAYNFQLAEVLPNKPEKDVVERYLAKLRGSKWIAQDSYFDDGARPRGMRMITIPDKFLVNVMKYAITEGFKLEKQLELLVAQLPNVEKGGK